MTVTAKVDSTVGSADTVVIMKATIENSPVEIEVYPTSKGSVGLRSGGLATLLYKDFAAFKGAVIAEQVHVSKPQVAVNFSGSLSGFVWRNLDLDIA